MDFAEKSSVWMSGFGFFRGPGCWRSLLRLVLLALALVLPIVFYLKTEDLAMVKVTFLQLGALAAVMIWLYGGINEERFEIPEKVLPFLVPAVLLALWNAVRYAFSDYRLAGLGDFINQEIFLVLFSLTLLNFSRLDIRRVVVALAGCWTVVVFYGLVQYLGLDPFSWYLREGGWVFSMLGLPSRLASYLAVFMPLSLALAYDDSNSRRLRLLAGAFALISVFVCVSTRFFPGIAFFIFAIVLFTVLARRLLAGAARGIATAVSAACLALCLFTFIRFDIASRLDPVVSFHSEAWSGVMSLISERPWLGHGPGSFGACFPEHRNWKLILVMGTHDLHIPHAGNEFLEQWVNSGLPGALLWLWLFGALLYRGWKASAGREAAGNALYTAGLFSATAAGLGIMSVVWPFHAPAPGWPFYFIAGLLGVAAAERSDKADKVVVVPLPFGRFRMLILVPIAAAAFFLASGSIRAFQSDMHQRKARMHLQSGRLDEAVSEFVKAAPGADSYVRSRYYLGKTYLSRGAAGDYERALEQFRAVRRMAPDYAQAHAYEAAALEKLNRIPEAVARMERHVRLDPVDPVAWLKLAELYEITGDTEKARAARRQAEGAWGISRETPEKDMRLLRY